MDKYRVGTAALDLLGVVVLKKTFRNVSKPGSVDSDEALILLEIRCPGSLSLTPKPRSHGEIFFPLFSPEAYRGWLRVLAGLGRVRAHSHLSALAWRALCSQSVDVCS